MSFQRSSVTRFILKRSAIETLERGWVSRTKYPGRHWKCGMAKSTFFLRSSVAKTQPHIMSAFPVCRAIMAEDMFINFISQGRPSEYAKRCAISGSTPFHCPPSPRKQTGSMFREATTFSGSGFRVSAAAGYSGAGVPFIQWLIMASSVPSSFMELRKALMELRVASSPLRSTKQTSNASSPRQAFFSPSWRRRLSVRSTSSVTATSAKPCFTASIASESVLQPKMFTPSICENFLS